MASVVVLIAGLTSCTSTPRSSTQDPWNHQEEALTSPKSPFHRSSLALSPDSIEDGGIVRMDLEFLDVIPESPPEGIFLGERFLFTPTKERPQSHFVALVGIPRELVGRHRVSLSANASGRRWVRQGSFRAKAGRYPSEKLRGDPLKVIPPPEEQPRIHREREQLQLIYGRSSQSFDYLSGFALPTRSTKVTSPFGASRIYNGEKRGFHSGTDLRAGTGDPIWAAAHGRVVLAADLYYTGKTVVIDHGYGLLTLYGHMNRTLVREGARVLKGARLGDAGSTGRVTGPHLHWGAILRGVRVDPMELLELLP